MTRHLSAFGVLLIAGAASAQLTGTGFPAPSQSAGLPEINEYAIDDGVGEDSVGLTAGGNIAFLNQFTVSGGLNSLTAARIGFGQTTTASINRPVFVGVWAVTGSGTTARPGALIGGQTFNASATTNPPPYNIFTVYNFTNAINLGADGTNFFLGFIMNGTIAGDFPAAIDQTAPTLNARSFAGFGTAALNQNDLGNVANTWGTIEGFGLPGNWLIRGDAVPTPGAAALLGIAGLAGLRRRR